MTFIAFLNELSFPIGPLDEAAARESAKGLIDTLRKLRQLHANAALHSSSPLTQIQMGEGVWLGSLLGDAQYRDEWRFLRGFENRAPFRVGLGETYAMDCEYRFQGTTAEGLGIAHTVGTLGVSFGFDPWLQPVVELERTYLLENGDTEQQMVEVQHASLPSHLVTHEEWLRRQPLSAIADGDELWVERDTLFPHLRFLPRSEAQIREFKAGELRFLSAASAMMDLELAVAGWDTVADAQPNFLSKTTPEHEMRRKKFKFPDLSGTERYFDMHSRYTPGAGRVHFWLDRANGQAQVAHVGEKVPD